jgi:hypothetical protein
VHFGALGFGAQGSLALLYAAVDCSSMDSPGLASLIAQCAFWALLVYGWFVRVLSPAQMMGTLGLWIAGFVGLPWIKYLPAHFMFPSYVAVLDIVLVLMIAGGDVRLR